MRAGSRIEIHPIPMFSARATSHIIEMAAQAHSCVGSGHRDRSEQIDDFDDQFQGPSTSPVCPPICRMARAT
jgi:hypothetical protein